MPGSCVRNRAVNPLYDGSAAIVTIDQFGTVKVSSGESEIGQGLYTNLAQIAAEELGIDIENIEVMPVDSDYSPHGMGVTGSRGTTLAGNAVQLAAKDARDQLVKHAAERFETSAEDLVIEDGKFFIKGASKSVATVKEVVYETVLTKLGGVPIMGKGCYIVPDYVIVPDPNTKYGNYSVGYSFSAQVAEVEIDPETGKVNVLDVWVGQDVGRALNPKGCEGQIEGGVVQGMGYVLSEGYFWRDGEILNPDFHDYKISSFVCAPKVHTFLVESNEPAGPYGAKSIGEAAFNPTAVAIANAIYDAAGVRLKRLPITPEALLKALKEHREQAK